DMQVALQYVEARINEIRGELPPELSIETQRQLPSLIPINTYNVIGEDPGQLYDIARYQIRPALAGIPGVGRIDVQGSDVREIEVVADPVRLAGLGLGYDGLAAAIEDALGVQAVGRVDREYRQVLVVADQQPTRLEDIAEVVLPGGVHVRDVATVTLGTVDRVSLIRGDGRPAALVNIARQEEGNTLQLADSVAHTMDNLRRSLPAGVRIEAVYDQAGLVRDAVGSVRDAMLVGALLAVLVLFVFLHNGVITAISALAIPLTMAITVFVMQLMGSTFNLMTLGGMAIAIGLVIDDAVVVTENIARHLALNPERRSAIRDAVAELVWPVTTSTLTTVVVFLPLGLLQGVVGQFFKALSVTLVIAVLVSLVLALALVPLLAEQLVTAAAAETAHVAVRSGLRGVLDRATNAVEAVVEAYHRLLEAALRHRWVVGAGAVLLVAGGAFSYRFLETGFLPIMDEGAFVLDYWTPTGTSLAETDRELSALEGILHGTPEVESTSRRTGAEMGLFATEQNTGDVVVRLKAPGERDRDIFQVMDEVRATSESTLPRLRVEFIQLLSDLVNDLAGVAEPVEIRLFGEDLPSLEAYAREVGSRLEGIDGLVDLFDGVPDPMPEMAMTVDRAAAAKVGLSPGEISRQLNAALLGTESGELRQGERGVGIRVRAPDGVRCDAERLGRLPVYAPGSARPIPLSALATFHDTTSEAALLRENQRQMIAVTGGVEGRSLGSVMKDVRAALAQLPPPQGISIELGGQYASQREAFRAMMLVLLLAALSVVAVMLVQFESFVEPLVILMAAPVSFVGAAGLLVFTGTQLNVSSLMGLILLVGLIVKNGIILLDFTRHRMRTEGEVLGVAVRHAARVRLRPILMTT
ncbi:MAG: efflux RND transporter permease subunit, partial [Gemmatimonadetes bacterium]|nr:efflux RND transporter permease subunit [Gemmatimonadota bacterium]